MSYIKLQDAKNAIMNCITEQTVSKYATSAECRSARHGADIALFALDDLPTADVVEVRHGKWLHSSRTIADKIYHRWQCSVCARTVATVKRDGIVDYPYCHCGAKMDGERKEE